MNDNLYSIIRYARLQKSVKLEHLATKLGISKSHLSLIERGKRNLLVNDFVKALNYLGYEIKIYKDGEDYMKKINKEGLTLREVGYSKGFKTLNKNNIMVWFNTLDNTDIYIAKDMYNENEYISDEKFSYYEEFNNEDKETGEYGYGEFYLKYMEDDSLWVSIAKITNPENIEFNNIAYELFDKNTLEKIKNTCLNLM